MGNELMVKKPSILDRMLAKLKRQKTSLEENTELYDFLRERYSEEKKLIGIIPIRIFGQEQLDKITGLDISGEDYIKSLKGINELHNLQELYCRLGIVFDYASVCEALSNENLRVKRLSIKSPEQLNGYDLSQLSTDVKLVGYDVTKKYEINDGKILEKKEPVVNKTRIITSNDTKPISYEDSLIEPERQEEYDYIMGMWEKVKNGEISSDDVKQLADIAFGKDTVEAQLVSDSIINSGVIKETTEHNGEKKPWELESEDKIRIQKETSEIAQKHSEQVEQPKQEKVQQPIGDMEL